MALFSKIAKSGNAVLGYNTGPYNGIPISGSVVDDMPKIKPFDEAGVSGLLRTKGVGYVYEEWLKDLSTYRQKQVYREMRDNDAVIGSMFFALEMILRRAEWRVEPAKGAKGDDYGEFIKTCMEDMSHTWEDFIAESISEFIYGYALFETVYKRRQGEKGKSASRYDDGLIGWRKFAPRSQESILYWIWDEDGGLQDAVQLAAPDYKSVVLPIDKCLLFRTTSQKNNPEGRSLLRNCYRSWFFKRRIEEVEGIGIERDLCGLPVLYVSAEALQEMGGMNAAKRLVTNIRVDDMSGVVLPMVVDENKNQMVKLELLRSGGSKRSDTGDAIKRYNQDILNTVLAGFIQFGQSPTGSRALHVSATQIFTLAITAFMDSVAAVMNRIAIPRLMTLNQMDLKLAPKILPGEVGVRDMKELSEFVAQLTQSGFIFTDQETQEYLRKIARLPDAPPLPKNPTAGPIPGQPPLPGQPAAPGQPLPGKPKPPVVSNTPQVGSEPGTKPMSPKAKPVAGETDAEANKVPDEKKQPRDNKAK